MCETRVKKNLRGKKEERELNHAIEYILSHNENMFAQYHSAPRKSLMRGITARPGNDLAALLRDL